MSSRILLIGATGRLGRNVLHVLQDKELDIVSPNRSTLDLMFDDQALHHSIFLAGAAVIINCAAFNGPEANEEHPDISDKTNNAAVGTMARVARETGALLIHVSTDYVKGDSESGYSKSKARGEQAIRDINPCHLILRVSSLYGDDFSGPLDVVKQVAAGRGAFEDPVQVLHQFCQPISVRLAAKTLCDVLERAKRSQWREITGTYDMVTNNPIWKRDLAVITLRKVFGDRPWMIREGILKVPRPVRFDLNVSDFEAAFDIDMPSPEDDMFRTIDDLERRGLLDQFRAT